MITVTLSAENAEELQSDLLKLAAAYSGVTASPAYSAAPGDKAVADKPAADKSTRKPAKTEKKNSKPQDEPDPFDIDNAAATAAEEPDPFDTDAQTDTPDDDITLDTLRGVFGPLNRHSEKAKKAVLTVFESYGAKSPAFLDKEKYADVYDELKQLATQFKVKIQTV